MQPLTQPQCSAGSLGRAIPGLKLRGGDVAPARVRLPVQPLSQQRIHL